MERGKQSLKTKAEILQEMEVSVIARNMEEVVLLVDDLKSVSGISRCRICHEEEFESSKTLEAPCGCSGTVKVNPDFLDLVCVWFTCDNRLICVIFFPVCSQRLHSDVVQWERKHNLWNMSPGMNHEALENVSSFGFNRSWFLDDKQGVVCDPFFFLAFGSINFF